MLTLLLVLLVAMQGVLEGASLTVEDSVTGTTPRYIGACSALSFYESDLQDLGINTYRFWTNSMQLLEWQDDNQDFGSPTSEAIRADEANGFANTIPWDFWDTTFNRDDAWRRGTQNFNDMFSIARQNDIEPIVVLRTWENPPDGPEWPISSPIDEDDLNEWWEHCFAIAYWLNVRNDYQVKYFEVLNEPDLSSQGWNGTMDEYVQLVKTAADAVTYASGLAGVSSYVMAPVVSNSGSAYVADIFTDADGSVDVADYHNYDNDQVTFEGHVTTMKNKVIAYDTDEVTEPLWLTEFGVYGNYSESNPRYDTYERAMLTAHQLRILAEQGVEGATIFSMYDWGLDDWGRGLININLDGGSETVYTETYYSYRLMVRGLAGGKDILGEDTDFTGDLMVTRGGDGVVNILVFDGGETFQTDISELGITIGHLKLYQYDSDGTRDELVSEFDFSGGTFSFQAPDNGIVLAQVEAVPEPGSAALVALSAAFGFFVRRRWRRRQVRSTHDDTMQRTDA